MAKECRGCLGNLAKANGDDGLCPICREMLEEQERDAIDAQAVLILSDEEATD